MSRTHTLKGILKEFICTKNKSVQSLRQKHILDNIRLWKWFPEYTGRRSFLFLKEQVTDSRTYTYSFEIEAKYLGNLLDSTIEEAEISNTDLLLIESNKR